MIWGLTRANYMSYRIGVNQQTTANYMNSLMDLFYGLSNELNEELINWEVLEVLIRQIAQVSAKLEVNPDKVKEAFFIAERNLIGRSDSIKDIVKLLNEYLNLKLKVAYQFNLQKYLITSLIGKDFFIKRILSAYETPEEEKMFSNWVLNESPNKKPLVFLDPKLKEYLDAKYEGLADIDFLDICLIPTIEQLLDYVGADLALPIRANIMYFLDQVDKGILSEEEKTYQIQAFKKGLETRYSISPNSLSPVIAKYTTESYPEFINRLSMEKHSKYFVTFIRDFYRIFEIDYIPSKFDSTSLTKEFNRLAKELEIQRHVKEGLNLPPDVDLEGVIMAESDIEKMYLILDMDSIFPH